MTYANQYEMSRDQGLRNRVAACAATQDLPKRPFSPFGSARKCVPESWAEENMLFVTAQPGWPEAWADALAASKEDPGMDPTVVTDAMITSAVQAVLVKQAPGEVV